jgi:hypothetical protein
MDINNNPLNGLYNITYNIYNIITGGTPLWTETYNNINIINGIVNTTLGSITTFPSDIFDNDTRWIEITINSDVLSPRTKFVSCPYAFLSEKAYNLTGSTITTLNGNLGIGTTNPSKRLHVIGETYISSSMVIGNGIFVDKDCISKNSDGIYLYSGNGIVARTKYYYLDIYDIESSTGLRFVKNSGTGETVTAIFDWNGNILIPNGNVGIGITNPNYRLYVNGDINISGDYYINGILQTFANKWTQSAADIYVSNNVGIGTTNPITPLVIRGGGSGNLVNSDIGILIDEDSSSNPRIELRGNNTTGYIDWVTNLANDYEFRIYHDGIYLNFIGGDVSFDNNIGIGTTNPQAKLHIVSTDSASSAIFIVEHSLTGNALFVTTMSKVGIGVTDPQYRLELPANADSTGQGRANAWQTYSSVRWKKEITPISNALEKTINLTGVNFYWKDNNKYDMGLIAEEVGKVVPEIVDYEENGYAKGMKYDRLVALLIEAIKEQKKKINEQNEQNIIRNNRILELERKLYLLEK